MNVDFLRLLPQSLIFAIWLIFIIINVMFAFGVGNDANELRREGGRTQIVGQAVWFLATLFGGVFVAAIYWVIHRSALSRAASHQVNAPQTPPT